jgi:hypothetical protein
MSGVDFYLNSYRKELYLDDQAARIVQRSWLASQWIKMWPFFGRIYFSEIDRAMPVAAALL